MNSVDLETVRIIALVTMCLSAICMTVTWRINANMRGLGFWALSACAGVAAFAVQGAAAQIRVVVDPGKLSSLIFLLSVLLLLEGVLRFRGHDGGHWRWLRWLLVAGIAAHGVAHDYGEPSFLVAQHAGAILFLISTAAALVWRSRGVERYVFGLLAASSMVLAWVLGAYVFRTFDIDAAERATHPAYAHRYIGVIAWSMAWSWGLVAGANIRVQKEIRSLARRDALTGLANRRELDTTFERALARAARSKTLVGLVLIDLDGFKAINDRLGHAAGDKILIEFSARLARATRSTDLAARLGGDEFVLLLENLAGQDGLTRAMARLRIGIGGPILLGATPIDCGFSLGGALRPDDGEALEALLAAADGRMYAEKSARRAAKAA